MKEIKFTTGYEPVLSFDDKDFKKKYEKRVGYHGRYEIIINNEQKHLAVCPQCNNPVVILGIYKHIDLAPHARHAKGIDIPGVAQYNEYKYLHCPYHRMRASFVKEYVPETEEPERREIYKIVKENYDKAIYLLQKSTGIHITQQMAEVLAENYVAERAYNYINATVYNIPWYLIYCFHGFPLYHMIIRKNSLLYKKIVSLGITVKDSGIKDHVYVVDDKKYGLIATDYRYRVDENDRLKEWLDFSIVHMDENVTCTSLFTSVIDFSISVDSYYFGNLVNFKDWTPQQKLLDVAEKYMNP